MQAKFGIFLPPLVAEFYQHFKGVCFAGTDWNEEDLDNLENRESILWNYNTFILLEDIISCEKFDIQEVKEETGRTFFPIIQTGWQKLLVMENGKKPVFDAFHEMLYNPEEWEGLYVSFEDLLEAYIEKDGDIETIG